MALTCMHIANESLLKAFLPNLAISLKLKKITGSCTQTTILAYLTLQNWKESNVTKMFWFKVEGWYFQTPTENVVSLSPNQLKLT